MAFVRIGSATLLITMLALLSACRTPGPARAAVAPAPVLLVCEHGSVKSLMAASLFNQAALERGLPFRAISRGVTPDEAVPANIVQALASEGFDVQNFKPTRVSTLDMSEATHVVAIGVDLSPFTPAATPVSVEQWTDVPAASVDYAAAHRALKQHVDELLDGLEATLRRHDSL